MKKLKLGLTTFKARLSTVDTSIIKLEQLKTLKGGEVIAEADDEMEAN